MWVLKESGNKSRAGALGTTRRRSTASCRATRSRRDRLPASPKSQLRQRTSLGHHPVRIPVQRARHDRPHSDQVNATLRKEISASTTGRPMARRKSPVGAGRIDRLIHQPENKAAICEGRRARGRHRRRAGRGSGVRPADWPVLLDSDPRRPGRGRSARDSRPATACCTTGTPSATAGSRRTATC